MTRIHRSYTLLATLLLACCGGGGNSPPPPAVVQPAAGPQAQADQFEAQTGVEVVLDVLGNDLDPERGGLTIVAVSAPNARIDGARLRYLAPCCTQATDRFTYTVRSASGRESTAEVTITIRLRIALTASAPLLEAPTDASVQVGAGAPLPLVVDGEGNASFVLTDPLDPDALIVVRFRRAPNVELVSVFGTLADLAPAATSTGVVTPPGYPRLALSPVTTALAGTIAAQGGGALPVRGSDWNARIAALQDWDGVARRAQVLAPYTRLSGPAVPDGTTLSALAADPVALDAIASPGFERSVIVPAGGLSDLRLGAGTYWLYNGGTAIDDVALRLDLAADATGTLVSPGGADAVRWFVESDGTTIERLQPDPVTPGLFSTNLVGRRGGVCNGGDDRLAPWAARVTPFAFTLYGWLPSARASAAPHAVVGSADEFRLAGFSPSSCAALFVQLGNEPDLVFAMARDRPVGAALPALAAGRWLLPFVERGTAGGTATPRHVIVDLQSATAGVAPGGVALDARVLGDGSLALDYAGIGTVRVHAVARYGAATRVVIESTAASGYRYASEAWIAPATMVAPLAARLRSARLSGCCRGASLLPLRFDAQGAAVYERAAPTTADVAVEPDGALRVRLGGDGSRDVVITPLVEIDARRWLAFSTIGGELPGTAEVLTLLPAP